MPTQLAEFGALLGPDVLILFAVGLAGSAFWLWMLIDCITNKALNDTEKIIWVLVVLFLHFIGALLYFFIGRASKARGPDV